MNPQTMSSPSTQRPASAPARPRQRKRGAWRRALPYVIGGALVLLIVLGIRPQPIEVEVATVTTAPLTVTVLEEGKTRIRHRYVISPPIAGILNRIPLRAGAPIEAGKTVLATIEPALPNFLDPRARAEAEARVQAAQASRMRSKAELERTQSSLSLAEKEKVRADELKKSGAISGREWDTAENEVAVRAREVRSAEFAVQVSEFELAQAQAAARQAQTPEGDKTTQPLEILAPVSGFILNVFEESARAVVPGLPLMEVGDPTDLEADVELLSSDAVAVRVGAEVSIEQWGGPEPLRGTVTLVEPGGFTKVSALGVEEQRVKVRVNFADSIPAEHPLGDRYRIEARIVTWHGDKVLQIPTGALFRRGADWMAFVVDGGKARLTKIEIAHNNGVAAELRSGLAVGARVILHPPDAITDGAKVNPRATP